MISFSMAAHGLIRILVETWTPPLPSIPWNKGAPVSWPASVPSATRAPVRLASSSPSADASPAIASRRTIPVSVRTSASWSTRRADGLVAPSPPTRPMCPAPRSVSSSPMPGSEAPARPPPGRSNCASTTTSATMAVQPLRAGGPLLWPSRHDLRNRPVRADSAPGLLPMPSLRTARRSGRCAAWLCRILRSQRESSRARSFSSWSGPPTLWSSSRLRSVSTRADRFRCWVRLARIGRPETGRPRNNSTKNRRRSSARPTRITQR